MLKRRLLEIVSETVRASLLEFRKRDVKVTLNGKEIPFGSAPHLEDLESTLAGLERLRDCYQLGSSNRLVLSQACVKIRKLIKDLAEK